jgi:PTH2 family peptidyl-tRNA hydrolase
MGYKQAIVVRKDLDIGKGKLAAQVAHASLGAVRIAKKDIANAWEEEGAKKVVLKAENLRMLNTLHKGAREMKLPCYFVRDAGLTQLDPGTVTCLGIGPAEEKDIDKVTKGLKLL